MKWILILLFSAFSVFANATPEAEALQIVTPQQNNFYVNPNARVTLKYKLLPDEFTKPVIVKVWLDGKDVGTMLTNLPTHEFEFGVLTPGDHTVVLEASGEDAILKTKPVTFSVRRPPGGGIGNVLQ